ncbi:MAG: UDP-2,3-diacylglucosamine diphosphatase [Longimicrobiales bacterium]|nr:UDP-2,3-diacylglucosamine diphosphatase [Longimicrobiales bacterium]
MTDSKPVLVASDAHLGASPPGHRKAFVRWLEHAGAEAREIILNGDLFDFWFEYRWGTTRGHEDVLDLLTSIVDAGVPVTLVGGNHDWWGGSYLEDEVGLDLLPHPQRRTLAGHRTFLAHGDGLGAGDQGYRILKRVLRSPLTRFAFGMLPIAVGDRIAGGVSRTDDRWEQWGARQQARSDALETFAVRKLEAEPELDLVLLGHTHLPLLREVEPDRWYVNSGDWVFHQSYVVLQDGEPPKLLDWRDRP